MRGWKQTQDKTDKNRTAPVQDAVLSLLKYLFFPFLLGGFLFQKFLNEVLLSLAGDFRRFVNTDRAIRIGDRGFFDLHQANLHALPVSYTHLDVYKRQHKNHPFKK